MKELDRIIQECFQKDSDLTEAIEQYFIKAIPERMETEPFDNDNPYYNGWNDCIERIKKGLK